MTPENKTHATLSLKSGERGVAETDRNLDIWDGEPHLSSICLGRIRQLRKCQLWAFWKEALRRTAIAWWLEPEGDLSSPQTSSRRLVGPAILVIAATWARADREPRRPAPPRPGPLLCLDCATHQPDTPDWGNGVSFATFSNVFGLF